jgi:hypothetical protein
MSAAERWEAPILHTRAVGALASARPAARLEVGRRFNMPEWVTLAMEALMETPLTELTVDDITYLQPDDIINVISARSIRLKNRYGVSLTRKGEGSVILF